MVPFVNQETCWSGPYGGSTQIKYRHLAIFHSVVPWIDFLLQPPIQISHLESLQWLLAKNKI